MGLFRRVVRLIAGFLRVLLPLIWRILRMMFFLATTSLASIWVGVPNAVNRIAQNWAAEATIAGIPEQYRNAIFLSGRVVASITLFLGWLVLASLTVFILNLVI